jgi:hypothetical protein
MRKHPITCPEPNLVQGERPPHANGAGQANFKWSPTGKARGTSMFFGGIRRSIPSYAQGFGGLSASHSSTAIGRSLLRRRINSGPPNPKQILFGHLKLEVGDYLGFGVWDLEF